MEYQQIIQNLQNLSGAHVWLLLAVLVFGICTILTVITFRQFNRHQDNFREDNDQSRPDAILIDTENSTGISQYAFSEKTVMIGRVEANDRDLYDSVVIPELTVGRRHAVIEFEDNAYWLQDQGSVNGSYVNGQRVGEKRRLRNGDHIKIHKFSFRFEHGGESSEFATSANDPAENTIPEFSLSPASGTFMRPNDVLASHVDQNDNILEIPLRKENSVHAGEHEQQRTQVLFRNDIHDELEKLKSENHDQTDEQIRKNIQVMTVQLFKGADDDKTLRLYSELLNGPPQQQPDYDTEEKKIFSQMSLLPDMDERVMEALGEFFSETQDDLKLPPIEITEKGNLLAGLDSFSSPTSIKPINEETRKGY